MKTQMISVDDLRRNFGSIKKKLPYVEFIVTDRGNPIGVFKATSDMKRNLMKQTAGAWKDTELDNDTFWDEALKKTSRKEPIAL